MSEEKTPIERLYENPKAKGFVNHLIQSYLPINKPTKVWTFKEGSKHKCCVCNRKLFDIEEAFHNLAKNDEKLKEEFMPFLAKQVNGEEVKVEDHPYYKYVTKGKAQAWTGEETDTYMCQKCIQELLDMVSTGLLMGDKNIAWLMNKMRRSDVFGQFQSSPNLSGEEKEKVKKIHKKIEKKKVATFADLGVLQGLKDKMIKEQKSK